MSSHQLGHKGNKATPATQKSQRLNQPAHQATEDYTQEVLQRAALVPELLTLVDVTKLQRTIGNRAVDGLVAKIRQRQPTKHAGTIDQQPVQPESEDELQMQPDVQREETPAKVDSLGNTVQLLALGPGPTADVDWRDVPAAHRRRVRAAMAIIRRVSNNRRLKNYFRDHAPGGTLNTLTQVVNRALIWELRTPGSLGLSAEGGSDMAYDTTIYRIGKWQIAATLLHEMGHLARFPTEAECEGAPEAARTYAPLIQSIRPRQARVGEEVLITGISFGASQSAVDKVEFNGVDGGRARVWQWRHNTQGQIRINVPAGAASGPVVVINNNVRSNAVNFTVLP